MYIYIYIKSTTTLISYGIKLDSIQPQTQTHT